MDTTNDLDPYYTFDMNCAVCEKHLGMKHCRASMAVQPDYCEDCRRAIRIAQMKETGTLPKL